MIERWGVIVFIELIEIAWRNRYHNSPLRSTLASGGPAVLQVSAPAAKPKISYMGTVIEVLRGALTADEIA
jgi:hypothetical protein